DRIAFPLGPAEEQAVIACPAGRRIFFGIAIGISPFHMRIARGAGWRRYKFQRNTRRVGWQDNKAAAERALDAHRRRILIAILPGNALIMVGTAPGIIGGPCARCRDLQDTVRLTARRRTQDEQVVAVDWLSVIAMGFQRDAISAGGPVLIRLEGKRRFPSATDNRTLRRCFLPFAIYPALGEDWRFHRP